MKPELNSVFLFLVSARKSRFHSNVGKRSYNIFYNRDYLHRNHSDPVNQDTRSLLLVVSYSVVLAGQKSVVGTRGKGGFGKV